MHPSLRKDTLRRSLRSIIFVVAACLLVWLWGNHHKVDVDIEFTVELTNGKPIDMSLTVYDKDNTFIQELSLPVSRDLAKANYRFDLKRSSICVTIDLWGGGSLPLRGFFPKAETCRDTSLLSENTPLPPRSPLDIKTTTGAT